MAMTRYRDPNWLAPWQELGDVTNRLSRMLGDRTLGETEVAWMPAVNVEETSDELVLTAELPGMRQEDVEIELENNVLTVRGRKEHLREEGGEDRRYHVWERRYGAFQRAFSLPRTVDADGISATFQDGVLHIRMPKAAEAKGRKIEIRSESSAS